MRQLCKTISCFFVLYNREQFIRLFTCFIVLVHYIVYYTCIGTHKIRKNNKLVEDKLKKYENVV